MDQYQYQALSSRTRERSQQSKVQSSCRRIRRTIVRRRHASHITVVLSKGAHSGPSVCLRARTPCPLRVSCPGADHAKRAAQDAGSCASVPPWVKTGLLARRSAHARTRTNSCASLLRSTPVYTFLQTVQISVSVREVLRCFTSTSLRTVHTHLCLCTKNCGVSRRVRPVSFVDDFDVLSLTLLHFSPVFPRFVSF